MENILTELEEDTEPKECPNCDGYGELPGNPNTNYFPQCPYCKGTGAFIND